MLQEIKIPISSFFSLPVLDTREKKIAAGAAVVAGIAAVCFGFYYAGSNTPSFSIYSPASNKNTLELFPSDLCRERVKEGLKFFFSCPAAKALWNEVNRAGKIKLECKPHVLVEAGGGADSYTRTLSISDQIGKDRITSVLLFETCNLKYPFTPTTEFVCSKTADEYAEWVEKMEHKAVLENQKITRQCIREGYWPKSINIHSEYFTPPYERGNWKNFEDYLRSQEESFHTDAYRLQWYRACDTKGLAVWKASNAEKWQQAAPKKKEEF